MKPVANIEERCQNQSINKPISRPNLVVFYGNPKQCETVESHEQVSQILHQRRIAGNIDGESSENSVSGKKTPQTGAEVSSQLQAKERIQSGSGWTRAGLFLDSDLGRPGLYFGGLGRPTIARLFLIIVLQIKIFIPN